MKKSLRLLFSFLLSTAALSMLSSPVLTSMPPHRSISRKDYENCYFIKHHKELLKRGVNAPWASPLLVKKNVPGKGTIQRILGPAKAPSGSWKALVILVRFTDHADQVNPLLFDTLLFGNKTGTLRDYYKAVSYNTLDIVTVNLPSSTGWYTAPQPYSYYVNGQNGFGTYPQNAQKLVEDVVALADSAVDYSQYDNDGDGYVDALFVVHTGQGAEYSHSDNDIWSHAWVVHTSQVRDGVHIVRYSMEPEYWSSPGDMTCGVYAHEMGHAAFGLPDLYDTDYSSEGLGKWSIMAGGSWNGPSNKGGSPSFPDAWCQFQMGFLTPTTVTLPLINQSINNAEGTSESFLLWKYAYMGNQYFLVQNRQKAGYDAYLPGQGLMIYHVDESVFTDNDYEWYPGYTSSGHYLVALEQADGLYQLEKAVNQGNSGDPFPGSTVNRDFNSVTVPGSNDYSGNITKVSVENISDSAPVMTADLSVGLMSADPYIAAVPDTVSSGDVFVGADRKDILYIENDGLASLSVSGIVSSLPEYTFSPSSFAISSGAAQPVEITFTPADTIPYSGHLTITSNDPAQPNITVQLNGRGRNAPVAVFAPDSIVVVLSQKDSTERTMTIDNTGGGNLYWSVSNSYFGDFNEVQNPSSLSGKGKVALMSSDNSGVNSLLSNVANYFTASGRFDTVDVINVQSALPSLGELGAYDAVVAFGWWAWINRDAAGNLLADFVDGGGNLLVAFDLNATGSYVLGGRFDSEGYWLIQPNTSSGGRLSTMGTVHYPDFNIMSGINSVYTYSKLSSADIAQTATCLARFGDGTPLVAVDHSRPGARVDISYPLFTTSFSATWGIDTITNADELILNAVEWLARGGQFWFVLPPDSGCVLPQSSGDIKVKFNSAGLPAGDYRTTVTVATNDPLKISETIPVHLTVTNFTGIASDGGEGRPKDFSLSQNYPNPFNPSTRIEYSVSGTAMVSLKVYDVLGREVAILFDGVRQQGKYSVTWNGTNSAGQPAGSGIYFYRLKSSNGFVSTKKMLLLK